MTAPATERRSMRLTSGRPDAGAYEDRLHLHWETALDRLELEVVFVERLLADPTIEHEALAPWDEPQLTGPIPADLVDRAVEIRKRQEFAEEALSVGLEETRRQHEFATRVDRATGAQRGPAVYVDVDA